jgi:hypothetical protein
LTCCDIKWGALRYLLPSLDLICNLIRKKKSDYEIAYQKALPYIRAAARKAIYDYLTDLAQAYFVPLLSLYLLGWSIGWTRRGLKS